MTSENTKGTSDDFQSIGEGQFSGNAAKLKLAFINIKR